MSIQLSLFNDKTPSNDTRPLPEIIAHLYQFPLARHDAHDGRFYAIVDWIRGVAQLEDNRAATNFWRSMQRRINELRTVGMQSKFPYRAPNGKTYQIEFASEYDLYRIVQWMDINTGLRSKVLSYLAKSGVILDEFRRNPEKAIDYAIESYRRRGHSDEWITERLKGVDDRKRLTKALTDCMIADLSIGVATNQTYYGLFDRSAKEIRNEMGLKDSANIRDHMPQIGVAATRLAEIAATELIEKRLNEHLDKGDELLRDHIYGIMRDTALSIGRSLDPISKQLGYDLATGKPLLSAGTQA